MGATATKKALARWAARKPYRLKGQWERIMCRACGSPLGEPCDLDTGGACTERIFMAGPPELPEGWQRRKDVLTAKRIRFESVLDACAQGRMTAEQAALAVGVSSATIWRAFRMLRGDAVVAKRKQRRDPRAQRQRTRHEYDRDSPMLENVQRVMEDWEPGWCS